MITMITCSSLTRRRWSYGALLLFACFSGSAAWCDEVDQRIVELKDKNADVREAAAKALGELKDARAAAPLAASLYNQPSVKTAVKEALVSIGVPSIEPLVRVMSADGPESLTAAQLLVRIGQPGEPAVASVVEVLVNSDFMGHVHAEYTLTKIGAPSVGPLVAALRDTAKRTIIAPKEKWNTKKFAKILGRIGAPAVPAMIAALKDDNPVMREAAVIVLGMVQDPRAIEPVLAAFKDSDQRVRLQALETMGKMGAPAVAPLVATLKDPDVDVRKSAASALMRIGAPAVAPLSEALKDPNPSVREMAAWVLEGLRHKDNGKAFLNAATSITCSATNDPAGEAAKRIEDKQIEADKLVNKASSLCLLHLRPQYRFYLVNASLLNRPGEEVGDILKHFVVDKQSEIAMMDWTPEASILVRVGETSELDHFEAMMEMPSIYIARINIARLAQHRKPEYWAPVSYPPRK